VLPLENTESLVPERTPTVLLVEDETLLRVVVADHLKERGFEVHEAATADEAVAALAQPDVEIDVIFTDVKMPGSLDGIGLAKWVLENRPSVPVLVTSGDVGNENIGHVLCGGVDFFAKPYDLDAVEGHIRQTIARRNGG
jgi:DNA-binding NtrC family response regulator